MNLSPKILLKMYEDMLTIRLFEEKTIELAGRAMIRGYLHPYIGEEAVAVGAITALEPDDYITSTHRGHGHCIAKGGDIGRMMAELLAKETGYCKGRGGSMHIADLDKGILGANGIVGGGIPIAVGAALGCILKGTSEVTLCFFGDGATNNGVFHESLNLSSIWKLPVIFICENNLYAVSTPISESSAVVNVRDRAPAYNMPGIIVDGNNVMEVYRIVKEAVENAHQGNGPTLIEAKTYRWTGHHMNDPGLYRPKEEVTEWKAKDPILRFKMELLRDGILTEARAVDIEQSIIKQVDEAMKFAIDSPSPSVEEFLNEISL